MPKRRKAPSRLISMDPTQEAARERWIEQHGWELARLALDGYRTEGRGAIVIHREDSDPQTNSILAGYINERAAQSSGGWPTEEAATFVQTYDPTRLFILIMLHLDGSNSVYVMELPQIPTVMSA